MSNPSDENDSSRHQELSGVYARYAEDDYSARWSGDNPGNRALVAERESTLEHLLSAWQPSSGALTLLDLGCGSSTLLPPGLARARRIGMDLLFERVSASRATDPDQNLLCADGAQLPFQRETFDIIVMSTVLSSVRERKIRELIASECTRVLRHGGAVLWYDMRLPNPLNPSTSPLRRRTVERLFPSLEPSWASLTLLPPLARRLGPTTDRAYPALARLPFLRSHLAGLLVKPVQERPPAGVV